MTSRSASGQNRNADQLRPSQDEAARGMDSQPEISGLNLSEPQRSGEDARRRGWFWHWNSIVTQYAPLIGLKGIGLLNSYTVWTDRRDESPHRGFAFPSQQSEADFYGEERSELITINKILVALDLIEIRKEMVLHPDGGKNYRVPHNLYRVKDHSDDYTLTAQDVLKVVELAAAQAPIFRYVRRIFSERFAPIDPHSPWVGILADVRQTDVWQRLAARVLEEETRASARSKAGHAARKGSDDASGELDEAARDDRSGDSAAVGKQRSKHTSVAPANKGPMTNVAASNRGLLPAVGPSNRGFEPFGPTMVEPLNNGGRTNVAPTNRMYDELTLTTTTTTPNDLISEPKDVSREAVTAPNPSVTGIDRIPPADGPAQARAVRAFEDANGRMTSAAERTLLGKMAERFDAAALHQSPLHSGWSWIAAAVYEAVEAGSAFVAPRRVREILTRWEREGAPAGLTATMAGGGAASGVRSAEAETFVSPEPAPEFEPEPAALSALVSDEPFIVAECGIPSGQVWAAVLDEIIANHQVSRADRDAWLRSTRLVGRGPAGELIVIAPSALAQKRIASRLKAPLRAAVATVIGRELEIEVRVANRSAATGFFAIQPTLDAKTG